MPCGAIEPSWLRHVDGVVGLRHEVRRHDLHAVLVELVLDRRVRRGQREEAVARVIQRFRRGIGQATGEKKERPKPLRSIRLTTQPPGRHACVPQK
jgi:hypothetical protein